MPQARVAKQQQVLQQQQQSNGADDAGVMTQTRHKTTDMIRCYTRLDNVHQHNAAQKLDL